MTQEPVTSIPKGSIIVDVFQENIIINDKEERFVSFSWGEAESLVEFLKIEISNRKTQSPDQPLNKTKT